VERWWSSLTNCLPTSRLAFDTRCEHVVDIPATLASRVRLLGTGRSDKNDPNDARSAIAALRAAELVPVRVEDHAPVLRLVSRRHTQLGWTYNKTACRHDAHRDLRRR
jgi:hypothetical protein